mmetsp:Transcript_26353/g.58983  ORF Transcript_26353/g.58983 Transcript_26353/m.58983 type:complete len:428 (-) Transcript_26353:144-1427(-)
MLLILALLLEAAGVANAREAKSHGWIITQPFDARSEWANFKSAYRKSYPTRAEEAKRFAIFSENLVLADRYNAEQLESGGGPAFGVTKFSDKSQDEFDWLFKGRAGQGFMPEGWEHMTYDPSKSAGSPGHPRGTSPGDVPWWKDAAAARGVAPRRVDWTEAGYVTPVKNQGQCGSCWAHSAAEQIESQWMIDAGQAMWGLSVQQLTSCTMETLGCGGGDTTLAYEQLLSNATKSSKAAASQPTPGLAPGVLAPYVQSMIKECTHRACTESCSASHPREGIGDLEDAATDESLTGYYVAISGYSFATPACTGACDSQNLTLLNANVASVGPASVCVNAKRWNLYVGRVVTTQACGGYSYDDLDHCVQLTGYDLSDSVEGPYYLVRNSWATNWGLDGYIKLSALGNTCGLADEATFVDVIAPTVSEHSS